MRLRRPHLWIAITSGCLVVSLALVDLGQTSPGPLASVHERSPDLSGSSGCSACHGGWRRDMTQACLECHAGVAEDIQTRHGLHGVLGDESVARCARCHSDHHGPSFAMVNAQSFAAADVPDRDAFEHQRVGFSMWGEHLEIDCTECHENAAAEVLPEGGTRYRGLDQACGTCHEDNHEGQMVLGCAKCHGQVSFLEDGLDSQGHDFFVPLTGGHAELRCDACHVAGEPTALDALGRAPSHSVAARECGDCHATPHAPDFLSAVAEMAGKSPRSSCGACHRPDHTTFREETLELAKAQHALTGFRLDPPHAEVGCAQCHDRARELFAERYPGRRQDDCASCHADPHGGQFAAGPFADVGCVGCHDTTRFEPHAFDLAHHERSAMPLTGSHVETECEACHEVPGEAAPRVFRGTPTHCSACHADAHAGFFAARAAAVAELSAPECGACHETTTFDALEAGRFDHGFWTGFAVDGAHAQESCEACHADAHEPDATGRTFGRVEDHFGRFSGCVTCHDDPHRGGFDGPSFPRQVDGRSDCARCHVTSSFRAFPDGFDHGRWTGFPLSGAHEAIGCTGCHEALRRPDAEGRTWGRARGKACADCHEDPHARQFDQAGVTSCARCHKAGKSFQELSFHHNWHSRFLLDEAHEKVACSACHEPMTVDGGRQVIRYKPLGMLCVDCHGVNEDQILRRARKKR